MRVSHDINSVEPCKCQVESKSCGRVQVTFLAVPANIRCCNKLAKAGCLFCGKRNVALCLAATECDGNAIKHATESLKSIAQNSDEVAAMSDGGCGQGCSKKRKLSSRGFDCFVQDNPPVTGDTENEGGSNAKKVKTGSRESLKSKPQSIFDFLRFKESISNCCNSSKEEECGKWAEEVVERNCASEAVSDDRAEFVEQLSSRLERLEKDLLDLRLSRSYSSNNPEQTLQANSNFQQILDVLRTEILIQQANPKDKNSLIRLLKNVGLLQREILKTLDDSTLQNAEQYQSQCEKEKPQEVSNPKPSYKCTHPIRVLEGKEDKCNEKGKNKNRGENDPTSKGIKAPVTKKLDGISNKEEIEGDLTDSETEPEGVPKEGTCHKGCLHRKTRCKKQLKLLENYRKKENPPEEKLSRRYEKNTPVFGGEKCTKEDAKRTIDLEREDGGKESSSEKEFEFKESLPCKHQRLRKKREHCHHHKVTNSKGDLAEIRARFKANSELISLDGSKRVFVSEEDNIEDPRTGSKYIDDVDTPPEGQIPGGERGNSESLTSSVCREEEEYVDTSSDSTSGIISSKGKNLVRITSTGNRRENKYTDHRVAYSGRKKIISKGDYAVPTSRRGNEFIDNLVPNCDVKKKISRDSGQIRVSSIQGKKNDKLATSIVKEQELSQREDSKILNTGVNKAGNVTILWKNINRKSLLNKYNIKEPKDPSDSETKDLTFENSSAEDFKNPKGNQVFTYYQSEEVEYVKGHKKERVKKKDSEIDASDEKYVTKLSQTKIGSESGLQDEARVKRHTMEREKIQENQVVQSSRGKSKFKASHFADSFRKEVGDQASSEDPVHRTWVKKSKGDLTREYDSKTSNESFTNCSKFKKKAGFKIQTDDNKTSTGYSVYRTNGEKKTDFQEKENGLTNFNGYSVFNRKKKPLRVVLKDDYHTLKRGPNSYFQNGGSDIQEYIASLFYKRYSTTSKSRGQITRYATVQQVAPSNYRSTSKYESNSRGDNASGKTSSNARKNILGTKKVKKYLHKNTSNRSSLKATTTNKTISYFNNLPARNQHVKYYLRQSEREAQNSFEPKKNVKQTEINHNPKYSIILIEPGDGIGSRISVQEKKYHPNQKGVNKMWVREDDTHNLVFDLVQSDNLYRDM